VHHRQPRRLNKQIQQTSLALNRRRSNMPTLPVPWSRVQPHAAPRDAGVLALAPRWQVPASTARVAAARKSGGTKKTTHDRQRIVADRKSVV
jgi:hypothetical protein